MSTNKKIIAKNTVMLYLRMVLTVIVGIYTSRVVLSVLGEVNYGLFNLVGGVIGLLGFLNMALGASTQRFLNSNRAETSGFSQQQIFTTSVILHIIVAVIVCLLLETVGLWFVYNKLVIPEAQFNSAIAVYHISVLSCFLSIVNTPYLALINSHERMGVYAYFSLLDVVLRLAIVFMLPLIKGDQLIWYAFLCLAVTVVMRIVYVWYCRTQFVESHIIRYFNVRLIKEMSYFSGWMIWGCIAVIFSNQGVTILINIFCGPILNASRALAASVQGILYQFSGNIIAASKPQITRQYGESNKSELYELVNLTTKSTFFMMLLPSVPLFFFTPQVLSIWLTTVPPMTAIFIRILIVDMLVRATYETIAIVNQAGGNVHNYQLVVTGFYLLQFVGAYFFLSNGFPAYYAYFSILICSLVGILPRLLIVRKIDAYDIGDYLRNSLWPIVKVVACIVLLGYIAWSLDVTNIEKISLLIGWSIILVMATFVIIALFGLTNQERIIIYNNIVSKIRKKHA